MNDTPSLPEKDLPSGRHQQLKEHLMREIQEDRQTQQPGAATRTTARRGGRRWLRPAFAVPAAGGALARALLAGFVVQGVGDDTERPVGADGKPTYSFAPHVNADTEGGARRVLARAATFAERSTTPESIQDDQFAYQRLKVAAAEVSDDAETKLEPVHEREEWVSVDGTGKGMYLAPERTSGPKKMVWGPDPVKGEPGYERVTNYRKLQSLPTDPDAMLDWLYAQGEGGEDRNSDQDAFVLAGDLLREAPLMPAEVGAALYRAIAKIPDVVVVPDAVNAAGKHGVAVTREDSYNEGVRDSMIFDKETSEYIGSRGVAVEGIDNTEPGQVMETTAVLERGVVDRRGQQP